MDEKLIFKYDRQGDILYMDKVPPYAEQETEELGDDVIARLNPMTGEIETSKCCFSLPGCCAATCLNCQSRQNYI